MFQDENLKVKLLFNVCTYFINLIIIYLLQPLLENGEYEFILDRACCQFEPDDQNYHRVVFSIYKHVDQFQKYNVLESTRHLGPLLFYLAFNKKPDNFLLYCLQTERYKIIFNLKFE